ncbi:MAG: hypothetical protein D6814_16840 [Calditrichaeota bacterium]|nr:MAG: hypothetical protein D6814_16840 [Calditrichota bacterium]
MGGMGLGPGLLDLLAEETNSRDLLQKLAGSQIYFLNHGRKRKRARELIQYSLLQKRLKKLIPLFDYILIAVPPLELYHDGYVWGRIADGMILVVHAYETPLKAIRNIKNKVAQLRIPLLGTILNRRNFSVPKFVYEWL